MGIEDQPGRNDNVVGERPKFANSVEDLISFAGAAENGFRQGLRNIEPLRKRLDENAWPDFGKQIKPIPDTYPVPVWFRGQPLLGEGLKPKCRRKTYSHVAQDENNFLAQFMREAHARSAEMLPAEVAWTNCLLG